MRRGVPTCSSDARLFAIALLPMLMLAILPAVGLAMTRAAHWLCFLMALMWLALWTTAVARRQSHQLHLLGNLLQALRKGEYGSRIHVGSSSLADVWREFNALAAQLGGEARQGIETDALLSQLLASLDLAVLVADERDRLVDVNAAAEHLLGQLASELLGRGAAEFGLSDWLNRAAPFIDQRNLLPGGGPWEVRRLLFRRHGKPHRLLVATNLNHALREEERSAWRRLIRVLGHEINNSLGPIQSTASLLREHVYDDNSTVKIGLDLIEQRSRSLSAFIRGYAELGRLPPPCPERVDVSELIRQVAILEDRLQVTIDSDTPETAYVDRTQLEQALINLVRNAVDAALETGGGVLVRWWREGMHLLIEIEDEGPGISYTDNLFVPFFTTKPGGSGIGLVLARQIVETHGGSLRLANRQHSRGASALVRLLAY
jgi:two-component system, NtrC family, nitrogen regulation sensor histidine kinase NtrY